MKFLWTLLLVLISTVIVGAYSTAEAKTQTLSRFTSDGCSGSPDGLGQTGWVHCCVAHDVWYWLGGSQAFKVKADEDLYQCLQQTLEKQDSSLSWLPGLYKWGVQQGGRARYAGISSPLPWHWGYGWSQNRSYQKISSYEM